MEGLSDRVAVVTGGAGGVGEAVGVRLAAEGAKVVLVDIDGDAVNPGPISTGMMDRIEQSLSDGGDQEAVHEQFATVNPMGRYGTPDEVANLVVWLLSDEASYCSGTANLVDGGLTAR